MAARTITSPVLGVGRFVPDQLVMSVSSNGQFNTANGSCLASGSGATFINQGFGWNATPQVTVTARNASGATTTYWTGGLMKLTPASGTPTLAASSTGGATVTSQPLTPLAMPCLLGGSTGQGPLALATWGRANRDTVLRRETW